MAFVYILYSPSRKRTYVGCSENWQGRLETHNAGRVTATRSGIPWRLVHLEEVDAFLLARRRETYLKTSAGRRRLKKLLGNPSLSETTGRTAISPQGAQRKAEGNSLRRLTSPPKNIPPVFLRILCVLCGKWFRFVPGFSARFFDSREPILQPAGPQGDETAIFSAVFRA